MRPIPANATRDAALSIANRAAGTAEWDRIRRELAEEIGNDIRTVLEQDHDVRLITAEDWRRLAALDDALAHRPPAAGAEEPPR